MEKYMLDNIKFTLLFILVIIGCLVGVIILTGVPIYYLEKYACQNKAEQMKVEYQYGFWTDCMIKYKGQWVPFKSFRSGVVE